MTTIGNKVINSLNKIFVNVYHTLLFICLVIESGIIT